MFSYILNIISSKAGDSISPGSRFFLLRLLVSFSWREMQSSQQATGKEVGVQGWWRTFWED